MFFGDLTTEVLTAAARGYDARHTALASNIANAETPGYKRIEVQFESALAKAVEDDRSRMGRGPATSLPSPFAQGDAVESSRPAVSSSGTTMRVDGSNVDPDAEMAELAANQLAHQTVVAMLDKRFTQFRMAVTGR
ncbi:flagellar basal body rod protein FlgB [Miltoncostaea marina]|uniref:flagellar basal body rod protein FlgB n=1 Tax=Miltoncostaea marina TaxID=2843215 RepID=UPI001C3C8D16|nr:flagellar basal body rod protein FlgB [Miltoncostaea marina]